MSLRTGFSEEEFLRLTAKLHHGLFLQQKVSLLTIFFQRLEGFRRTKHGLEEAPL
jgi:hypothetical protein